MDKKVIPFQQKKAPSMETTENLLKEERQLKASGEATRRPLADFLREEAERVRTVALLMEVAETMCREADREPDQDRQSKEKESLSLKKNE